MRGEEGLEATFHFRTGKGGGGAVGSTSIALFVGVLLHEDPVHAAGSCYSVNKSSCSSLWGWTSRVSGGRMSEGVATPLPCASFSFNYTCIAPCFAVCLLQLLKRRSDDSRGVFELAKLTFPGICNAQILECISFSHRRFKKTRQTHDRQSVPPKSY